MNNKISQAALQEKVDQYFSKKLEEFTFADGSSLEKREKEKALEALMSGEFRDLGGLTAIRGFLYQYYVAMYYIVDMIHPTSNAWWKTVIFEFLDDIALYGEETVRFIQVKTVREGGDHKITPGKLYKRSQVVKEDIEENLQEASLQGLNSWVDKLFLNNYYFNTKKSSVLSNEEISEHYKIQFELATNSSPQSLKDFQMYSNNFSFLLDDISDEDKLLKALDKEVKVFNKKPRKGFSVKLKKFIPGNDIKWGLKRFYINKLGPSQILQKTVEDKIVESLQNTKDEDLKKTVGIYIFNKLLFLIISRTHQDHEFIDKMNLVFKKAEIEDLMKSWEMEIKDRLTLALIEESILGKFRSCFSSIKRDIEENWRGQIRDDLIDSLQWFEAELTKNHQEDKQFYYKFLNRLFELNTISSVFDFEDIQDVNFLRDSLKCIIYSLALYEGKNIPYKEARLLFHSGFYTERPALLFSIYNGRNKNKSSFIKNKILISIDKCQITSGISEDYICIVLNDLPDRNKSLSKLLKITESINDNASLIATPSNVRFIKKSKIDEFFEETQDAQFPFSSLRNSELEDIWINYIKESDENGD
ncbi:hypothetical protein C1N83_00150 [Priestia aryabhattai]